MTPLLAILIAIAAATLMSADAGAQVFRATVEGVAVDVLVTRDRRPVTRLTATDWRSLSGATSSCTPLSLARHIGRRP